MSLIVVRQNAEGQPIDPSKSTPELQSVAKYLLGGKYFKMNEAKFQGNRVDYFKGSRAIESLLSENYIKSNPLLKISSTNEATDILKRLMEEGNFFFRVEKTKYRSLQINQKQLFDPDGYYIWQWEHPWVRTKRMIYSGLMIAFILTMVLYPLWPSQLRSGLYYLSMAMMSFLGFLFVIAIVRLIVFPITLILPWTKPGIWLFPNLFADVGVIDSFIPIWGWSGIDYEKQHHEKYRSKNRSPQKKKKQNSETTSKPKIEKLSSKSPLSAPGGSLLEPTGITEIIDDGDQSDEPVEEIIMERKN